MKTHAIEWTGPDLPESTGSLHPVENLNSATRLVRTGILALAPALTLIVGAAWMLTMPQMVVFLQAALWTSGILFFGLALDSQKATIGLSLATGFALPFLALLSSTVAVEFAIVAVALLAAWVAAAIYNHAK